MLAKVRRVLITAQFSAQRPPTGLARGPNILLTGNILRLVRPAAVPVAVEHRACRAIFDWRLEPANLTGEKHGSPFAAGQPWRSQAATL